MSTHTVFGARIVAVASLASLLVLAGCSSSAGSDPAAARTAAGATDAPVATGNDAASSGVVPVVADMPSTTSQLTVSCDGFASQPKGSASVHLKTGDVMALNLCTNASTGFSWGEPLVTGDALRVWGAGTAMPASGAVAGSVTAPPLGAAPSAASTDGGVNAATGIEQGPSGVVGAASSTTFLLKADHVGTATVGLSYSRPWAGGEKDVWEYTLHVTID